MTTLMVPANGIELCYERRGSLEDPAVVLVMGLGVQMIGWPEDLVEGLVDGGHQVVRFDNRDIGLSAHLGDAPKVNLQAILGGDRSSAPYRLADMADDTVGLLDALEIERAHLVGVSLGGMIVQQTAIDQPGRVASLTSIMSTTGAPDVGRATPEATALLFAPPATTAEEAADRAVAASGIIGSTGFPPDLEWIADTARRAFERAWDPAGVGRQLAAIFASGDRTGALASVTAPALVVHGTADTLIDRSGGIATAAAIPGARLELVEGMGHDLPPAVRPRLVALVAEHVAAAERAAAERAAAVR
jgi:pimeloyl-ACP methyl ester carboxylesterase